MDKKPGIKDIMKPFEEQKSYMDMRVKDGIEVNRKGIVTFIVTDESGDPVRDVTLRLKQRTHEFKHGANIFMLDELETKEKNDEYKKYFAEAFNLATIPFYWNTLEPEDGKPRFARDSEKIYRRPAPDLCIEYCIEHGIEPKLHCLNYDAFRPDWLTERYKTSDDIKKRLLRRMEEIAERYADVIPGIEVINESLCWSADTPATRRRDKRYKGFLGEPDIVEWSFKQAEKLFPSNDLIINEGLERIYEELGDRASYYMQIERALLKGARIDTIGIQYHYWLVPNKIEYDIEQANIKFDPFRVYELLDTYARLGKPLQITEITLPTPLDGSEEGEAMQAEILKNMYSMWFSHPAVSGAIYWNLVDGYAYGAEPGDMTNGENKIRGGLLRFDLTPKPAFNVIKKLFNEEWHTDETSGVNDYGAAYMKAFYGDYDLEITRDGRTETRPFTFSKKNTEKVFEIKI